MDPDNRHKPACQCPGIRRNDASCEYHLSVIGTDAMNNQITASLTPQEWDYIAMVLAKRPYEEVFLLIENLKGQLQKPAEGEVTRDAA